jgi:DNA-binding NarL/FixJ family response regulator
MATATYRALVVDDHPLFRQGLAQALRGLVGVGDVVETDGVADALSCWRRAPVDLVTIDLSLPDGDGFSLLRQAREEHLPGAVVVVSMHDDRAYAARARAEGARGYIVKTASPEETTTCLQRVLAGEPTFQWATPPTPTTTSAPSSATATWKEGLVSLSAAERRVVVLLARRLTSRAIAGVLGVSVRTVENHRANIARKLDLRGPHRLLDFALAAAPLLGDDDAPDPPPSL